MKFKHLPLSVVTAALLAGSATLASAEEGNMFASPSRGPAAAPLSASGSQSADRGGSAISSQQKRKKQSAGKNQKSTTGSANCPPEHKAAGHC
jgi:hypothetical protein